MAMWKRLIPFALLALLPVFGSCLLDAEKVKCKDCGDTTSAYLPLTERDNLLQNLEQAYNQRNFAEYKKLFDNSGDFLFFFSTTDVNQGLVKDSSWDIGQDLGTTEAIFDRNPPPGAPLAENIDLELTFTAGDDEWQPVVPSTHLNETWYEKPVEYRLTVTVGGTTYTQNKNVVALFTVRFTQVAGDSVWQIVTWRDDI